jgi:hypothetical protein
MGTGWRWRQARSITEDQWKVLFDIGVQNWELLRTHPGDGNQADWFVGIRARSDPLERLQDVYSEFMTRSRIILFHPSMSTTTTFLPQKAAWYTEILQRTEDILGVAGKFNYPYVLGGATYTKARDLHASGARFKAYDGVSWDSSVGLILGPSFRPFMVRFKDIFMLPSGISVTSLLGTMANVASNRHVKGEFIALGDDMNYWGNESIKASYIGEAKGDTKYKYTLGVAYEPDIEKPRVTGVKMTMDRAKKARPLKVTRDLNQAIMTYRRDNRSRVAWAGLLLGWFGERSLIHALEGIPPGEYISPGEILEQLVEEGTEEIDPYAWADREGIRNVFA